MEKNEKNVKTEKIEKTDQGGEIDKPDQKDKPKKKDKKANKSKKKEKILKQKSEENVNPKLENPEEVPQTEQPKTTDSTNTEKDSTDKTDKNNDESDKHQAEDHEETPELVFKDKKRKKKKKPENIVPGDPLPWDGTDRDYNYTELLERIFTLLREKNPTLAGGRKRHVMPPPQLVRVGTRKTMWANFLPICQQMHRQPEHAMSFLLAELGTEGSIDGNQRCIMKGRYLPKQIESILKKYILEYVTCHMCRIPETTLTRDSVTRLYFIQCESCGSRRSVAPIKTGFHAPMRTDRRKVKDTKS